MCPNLGLTRIGVGIALLITLAEVAPLLFALTSPETVRAPRFDGLPRPTSTAAWALLLAWMAGATGLLLGWKSRWAGGLVLACLGSVLALDEQLYSNHLYLLLCVTLLLTIAESDAYLSLAALPRGSRRTIRIWPVLLMKVQLSVVYFFAALTKLNIAFLSGGMLAVSLQEGLIPFPEALRRVEVLAPAAWVAVLLEGYLSYALWSERRRHTAAWLGIMLHIGIAATMGETLGLAAFSVTMLALYPLFFANAMSWAPSRRLQETPLADQH